MSNSEFLKDFFINRVFDRINGIYRDNFFTTNSHESTLILTTKALRATKTDNIYNQSFLQFRVASCLRGETTSMFIL